MTQAIDLPYLFVKEIAGWLVAIQDPEAMAMSTADINRIVRVNLQRGATVPRPTMCMRPMRSCIFSSRPRTSPYCRS
jgi:hypothetical protein